MIPQYYIVGASPSYLMPSSIYQLPWLQLLPIHSFNQDFLSSYYMPGTMQIAKSQTLAEGAYLLGSKRLIQNNSKPSHFTGQYFICTIVSTSFQITRIVDYFPKPQYVPFGVTLDHTHSLSITAYCTTFRHYQKAVD